MLEEHVPPPRVWTSIAAAIEVRPRRVYMPAPFAIAASLVLLIATAAWFSSKHPFGTEAPQQARNSTEDGSLPRPEAQYEQAIAGLQQLANAQNGALDTDTRAVLQQNLAAIDRAIDESRAALADEPASALAQESLLDALDTKVALLQDTVALSAEDVNQ